MRPPLIELHDDEIRFLYHRGLIDGRTNRDAIHGRGAERAAARVTCAAFVDRLELTLTKDPDHV